MVIQLGNKNSDFGLSRAYLYAYRLGILSAFILFLLGTHLLLPISIDTNVAEGTATPSTTTLAINTDYSSANLDFTTISSTGTFASSSAEDIAKFTVTTNNYTGYTLTLAGNDDTGQLNNISAGAALDTIATSGIESSSFSTNEWGYLPSKYNSEANTTKYYSAPTTSDADTLDVTNAANSTANEYTIGLGAKVDYSKPAGTYTNTFILAAVGNPVSYSVNYLDNTGDPTVDNMPNAQASTTTATSITLAPYGSTTPDPADVPTRTDYRFLGWCDVATTNDGKDCSGNMLQTGDTISIDQTSTNVTNLYAVWKSTIINYIQNWASCSTLNTGDTITLTDKRDNEEYLVGKLADGNCWLLDNMRLDLTAVDLDNQDKTGLVGNTNADATTLGYLKNGGGASPYPANGVVFVNGAYGATWVDAYNLPYIATGYKDTTTTSYGSGSGKIGIYYNFCAASAGSYCYAGNASSGNASQDICPAGWNMPSGGSSSGQYKTLYTAYSSNNANFRNALSTPLSGLFQNNSAVSQGAYGYYWSSTFSDQYSMYKLDVDYSNVGLGSSDFRYLGLTVRCVQKGDAENMISGMSMQEIGNLSTSDYFRLVNSMETGKSYTTYDSRDDQPYQIVKFADNHIWMENNLNFGGDDYQIKVDNLDSNNTHVSEPVSVSVFNSWKKTSGSYTLTSAEYIPAIGGKNYGTLYNFCAASAGTICQSSSYDNATSDLCPAGWRLPTGSSEGEFQALYNLPNYNSYEKMITSVSSGGAGFLFADSFGYGGSGSGRSEGLYWSSTNGGAEEMYQWFLWKSQSSASSSAYSRKMGFSIRCILSQPVNKMTMQEIGRLSKDEYIEFLESMTVDVAYTTLDSRDGEEYYVAKLKDGNVWMLNNIRLDLVNIPENILKGSTNASDITIEYLKNNGGGRDSNYSSYAVDDWGASDYYDRPLIMSDYKDSKAGSQKKGIYYNYCAASAGTYCYTQNAAIGNASEDICPVGWKMPSGDASSGSYYYLRHTSAYYMNTDFNKAFPTILSGFYRASGSTSDQATNSHLWSSTRYDGNNMYYFNAGGNTIDPQSNDGIRNYGFSVRCVLKDSVQEEISTMNMQDIGTLSSNEYSALFSSMTEGRSYTAIDARDDKTYTIAKINNNLWMTSDLRFTETTLDKNTSNVSKNTTMTYYNLVSNGSSSGEKCYGSKDNRGGYYYPCLYEGVVNGEPTVWYNYAAATANTITGYSNTDTQQYDICPKGWRLPTNAQQGTISSSKGASTYIESWKPTSGGYYASGQYINSPQNTAWWSSISNGSTSRNVMEYTSSLLYSGKTRSRDSGIHVRCIRAS